MSPNKTVYETRRLKYSYAYFELTSSLVQGRMIWISGQLGSKHTRKSERGRGLAISSASHLSIATSLYIANIFFNDSFFYCRPSLFSYFSSSIYTSILCSSFWPPIIITCFYFIYLFIYTIPVS